MMIQETEPETLDRQAHHWVAQLVSGEASTIDADAIKQWRRRSPAHEAAFAAAAQQWRDFGPAGRRLRARNDLAAWAPPLVSRRALLGAGAVAAGAAGYAVVSPPLQLWPSLAELAADYRTVTGEQRHIALADDVSVQMNSQTSIAMPSSARDRDQVRLIVGEAAFTTTSRKALEVLAGDGHTVATQARFNIRNIESTVCITCFDGELRVQCGAEAVTIAARQQVRYDADGLKPAVTVDPAVAAAWLDGFLVFHLTPLADVIGEINRYRPGRVILMNATLGRTPVNGRFSIHRMDEVLAWIQYAFGAKSRALPGGIVLLG